MIFFVVTPINGDLEYVKKWCNEEHITPFFEHLDYSERFTSIVLNKEESLKFKMTWYNQIIHESIYSE